MERRPSHSVKPAQPEQDNARRKLVEALCIALAVVVVAPVGGCNSLRRKKAGNDPLLDSHAAVTPHRRQNAPDPLLSGVSTPPSPAAPSTLAPSRAALAASPTSRPGTTAPTPSRDTIKQASWTSEHLTWEQVQEMLRQRGVVEQQLEMRNGQWHLRCFVVNPNNPNLRRGFDATAASEVEAALAVIRKIDSQ